MSSRPNAVIVLAVLLLFSSLLAACGAAPAALLPCCQVFQYPDGLWCAKCVNIHVSKCGPRAVREPPLHDVGLVEVGLETAGGRIANSQQANDQLQVAGGKEQERYLVMRDLCASKRSEQYT